MRPFTVRLLVLVAVLGASTATASAAPPFNDGFGSAQVLAGEAGDVTATSREATKEVGEPPHAGNAGGASVWFRWVAQRDGTLTVWLTQTTFNTVLGIYTGTSVDALTEIASNDDYGAGTASRVTIAVDSGVEYRIAVDGVGGANGSFRIRWRQGPENDNFADARTLADAAGSVEGSSFGSTTEPGEATDLSAASSWFRWTAPASGTYGFVVENARGVTVFTGSSVEQLVAVGPPGTWVSFEATAGTLYSVRVAGRNWSTVDPFVLRWGAAPPNDAYSAAGILTGRNGRTTGSTVFATLESGEPSQGANSVWFSWTAPATGHVRFDAWQLRSPTWWTDTILTVYKGATLDTLEVVARNDDWFWTELPRFGSAVSFRAAAGTTYSISVTTFNSFSWGPFGLRWYPGAIIFGGSGSDRINGTSGDDVLLGRGGNDVLHGLGGNDTVIGGSGRDRLFGDRGSDFLNSRDFVRGNDELHGGPGRDRARRDRGDTLNGVP
ncbi:MAG TPA: hypothetical protein VD704_14200 [Gaiellaceae bacterium]|nr:hypothetical protein [Gaiellaceae bacterium]